MDVVTYALLKKKIELLSSVGKFLSLWDATTGMPVTNPSSTLPYTYTTGDYYRVSVVASGSGTNYKPSGTSYTGAASTTAEAQPVMAEDIYIFDGSVWTLLPHLKLADYYTTQQCNEKFVKYMTTAPTADNTTDAPIIVYLASEPATKYAGYIYMIKE